jgi:ATP-binding cassette subfamily B protein
MQRHIFSLFWQAAMRRPLHTTAAIVGATATAIIGNFIGPLIISQLLGQLQHGALTLASSQSLILWYVAVQVYSEVIGMRIVTYTIWIMEADGQQYLYDRMFKTLTTQSLAFHSDRFSGSLVSQSSKLVGSFERFWDSIVFNLVPIISSIVGAITILSLVFWQYAVVIAVISILFAIAVLYGSKILAKRNKEEAQASTAIGGHIADAITNIAAIKSHGSEMDEQQLLDNKVSVWRDKTLATMRGFLGVSSMYSILTAAINILALVAAIWASEAHLISISTVYLCITYTFTVASQLWQMNGVMRNYNRIIGDAHDMTEIISLPNEVEDMKNAPDLTVSKGAIQFNDMGFTHDSSKDHTLFKAFNLMIKPGERVGLVGHSGSGKTTLTRLLLRFSNIDHGSIVIDGQNIAEVAQDSLRRNIAYVPQEPMLFHRSLRENIAYGKPDATEKEIKGAAAKANALQFIEDLPEGFDTLVGERGIKLSGGQRQRIAIARAILKDAPILLLDEATSALDSESEKLIQDALSKLMKGRTSIVIAHRLSTIAKLDRIVVLENGTIREEGSHNALLTKKGIYAKLWSHQSGGFIEE